MSAENYKPQPEAMKTPSPSEDGSINPWDKPAFNYGNLKNTGFGTHGNELVSGSGNIPPNPPDAPTGGKDEESDRLKWSRIRAQYIEEVVAQQVRFNEPTFRRLKFYRWLYTKEELDK